MSEDETGMDQDKIEETVEEVADVFRRKELNYHEFVFTLHQLHVGVNELFMQEFREKESGSSE